MICFELMKKHCDGDGIYIPFQNLTGRIAVLSVEQKWMLIQKSKASLWRIVHIRLIKTSQIRFNEVGSLIYDDGNLTRLYRLRGRHASICRLFR